MPPDEIVHRWTSTAICHGDRLDVQCSIEQEAGHMRGGTDAAVRLFCFVGIFLEVEYELIQVICRKILSRNDYRGRMRGQTDGLEVALGIILDVRRKHRRGNM